MARRLEKLAAQLHPHTSVDSHESKAPVRPKPLPIKILGMGHFLPKRVVDNEELEKLLGKKKGYVDRTKAGVKTRRWANPLTEQSSDMGAHAIREACENSGITLSDIDCIISCGGAPERTLPDLGCLIQGKLGLSGFPCFHVHNTCLSFLTALLTACGLLNMGVYKRIAIVAAETPTACLDIQHAEQCILFSDGAAAAIVSLPESNESNALLQYVIKAFSEGANLTTVQGGGTEFPPRSSRSIRQIDTKEPMRPSLPHHDVFFMDGPNVVDFAVSKMEEYEKAWPGITSGMAGLDIMVPHQASGLALTLFESFGWEIVNIMEHHGNMMAASIPLALYYAIKDGRVKRGSKVGMAGTGAGFVGALFVLNY